jgi:hypothetical protein
LSKEQTGVDLHGGVGACRNCLAQWPDGITTRSHSTQGQSLQQQSIISVLAFAEANRYRLRLDRRLCPKRSGLTTATLPFGFAGFFG